MSKSLQIKFAFVMLLVIVLLMIVVLSFLVRGVQDFYTNQFYSQMEAVFTQTGLVEQLCRATGDGGAVDRMHEILVVFSGELGIDGSSRHFYVLDGTTGETLDSSAPEEGARINITPNVLTAILGENALKSSLNTEYMDVAVPIVNGETGESYVIYIIDDKQSIQSLNDEIYSIILQAVLIGFVISIAVSLIISRTLLSPIKGMTTAAEAMSGGDFSKKIKVDSKDEIGILAETFNDMAAQIMNMVEELKTSERLRREFVANVSHELRTPLTSIRTYAETMSEDPEIPQETEGEFLHVIINESDRMAKIVQDLLELSRIDSGTIVIDSGEFSIEQSLRDVYAAVALDAKKRGQEISLELEWRLPDVTGDRARFEQVLMNVVSNAVKYTADGGRISISAGSSNGNVRVVVEDDGEGIPKEDLARVFDRFYRVDKARSRESGGTGLGLSIAKEIITMLKGTIEIDSEVGSGTTVTITLPVGSRG